MKIKLKKLGLFIVLSGMCLTLLVLTMQKFIRIDDKLQNALNLSGKNRAELEKVLDNYKLHSRDSLKLKAAKFLIENSIIHSYTTHKLTDRNGQEVKFFPPDYGTGARTRIARDSVLEKNNLATEVRFDCKEIDSKYLISHIDSMISVWQSSAWHQYIKFDQFCRFLLPYRAQGEPLSQWFNQLRKKYLVIGNQKNCSDILSVANAINGEIAKDIKYNVCWIGGLGSQSVTELIDNKSGMCDDLSAYGVCAMRSCGIPSAVDFTIWAKMNFGHSWGVVFDERGKAFSFGPGELNPGEHIKIFSQAARRRLAKVFRSSFQINDSGLWSKVKNIQNIPPFLRQMNIWDVTSEYVSVSDIILPINTTDFPDGLAYICVYNNGRWQPVHWSKVEQSEVKFTAMGNDILYLIGRFDGNELIPVTDPFIFDLNNKIKYLKGDLADKQTVVFEKYHFSIGLLNSPTPRPLYKWEDNEWKFCQEVVPDKDFRLTINNLQVNRLYRFEMMTRPFTIQNNEAIPW